MPWRKHLVSLAERVDDRDVRVVLVDQPVVGDHDHGVGELLDPLDALLGDIAAPLTLEAERTGNDGDGQRAAALRRLGDDGRGAAAGAAAHAGSDEDHVDALEVADELLAALLRRLRAALRIAAHAQPARLHVADPDADGRLGELELLRVSVDREELHPADLGFDHSVDGVAAAAADAHDLDRGHSVD